jgi:Flp pilus assembly protein TadB
MEAESSRSSEVTAVHEGKAGEWFENYVRFLGGIFMSLGNPTKRLETLEAQREKVRLRLRQQEEEYNRYVLIEVPSMAVRDREERKLEKLQKRLDNLEELITRRKYQREIYFAGLEVTPTEIHYAALGTFFLSAVALAALVGGILLSSPVNLNAFFLLLLLSVLFVPMLLYLYLYNYPSMLSRRLRVQTLGRAPEAIHYMAMSLRLNPSLHQAVQFSAENVGGTLGEALGKIHWDTVTRKQPTLERSYMAFANEWGHWNEDFMRSLQALKMGVSEKTPEGRARHLEKAHDIILSGTRRKIDEFAASLAGPTTIFFGLGVLLPMVIGAMMPMIFLANLGGTINLQGGASNNNSTISSSAFLVTNVGFIVVMTVVFPLIAYIYAVQILNRRPGTLDPAKVRTGNPRDEWSLSKASLVGLGVGLAVSFVGVLAGLGYFNAYVGSVLQETWTAFIVLGISLMFSIVAFLRIRFLEKRHRALYQLEQEFPDTFFQIASQMGEGVSLNNAIQHGAEGAKGTESAKFFQHILYIMHLSGQTPEQVLFGSTRGPGVMEQYPSRPMRVAMRALLEASKKGPEAISETVLPMAEFLKELRNTDQNIRTSLKGTTQMMRGSVMFFTPVVIGITGALYLLLSSVLANGALIVPAPIFFLVMGVYLVEITFIVLYFAVGVEWSGDRVRYLGSLWSTLWISSLIYVFAAIFGVAMLTAGV